MTFPLAVIAAFIVVADGGGCSISYSGQARPIDPSLVARDSGWIVAHTTPVLHQPGSRDCGAASIAMVANSWNIALSVQAAVAALPPPSPDGVRLDALRDIARDHGLQAFAIAGDHDTLVHELRNGRPVIVGLMLPFGKKILLGHYEVVVATHPADDHFATIDPASAGNGMRVRTWASLNSEWQPAGFPTLVVIGTIADTAANR